MRLAGRNIGGHMTNMNSIYDYEDTIQAMDEMQKSGERTIANEQRIIDAYTALSMALAKIAGGDK